MPSGKSVGGASVDANSDFAGAEMGGGGGLVVAGDILEVAGRALAGADYMLGGVVAVALGGALLGYGIYELV
jgi:hypothetical protein